MQATEVCLFFPNDQFFSSDTLIFIMCSLMVDAFQNEHNVLKFVLNSRKIVELALFQSKKLFQKRKLEVFTTIGVFQQQNDNKRSERFCRGNCQVPPHDRAIFLL